MRKLDYLTERSARPRRLRLLLALLLLTGILAACEGEGDAPARVNTEPPAQQEQSAPTATEQPEQSEEPATEVIEQEEEAGTLDERFVVGDVIEARGMWMTVNEVRFVEEDEVEFFGPDAGNRFVIVDVTFENRTDSPKNLSSLLQTELRDGSGQRYTTDIMAVTAAGGSTLDGEIAPGDRLRGQAGFQVPTDATGLVFYYDASVFGLGQQVRVALD